MHYSAIVQQCCHALPAWPAVGRRLEFKFAAAARAAPALAAHLTPFQHVPAHPSMTAAAGGAAAAAAQDARLRALYSVMQSLEVCVCGVVLAIFRCSRISSILLHDAAICPVPAAVCRIPSV